MNEVRIIGEIASAHMGDVNKLYSMVKAVADTGANGVKFQWYKYNHLAVEDYYFYEGYKKLFITENDWAKILSFAKKHNLEIWIDIFDDWGLNLAGKYISMIDGFKIPPTIIQSDSIIEKIMSFNKVTILGVGGWKDKEIKDFLSKPSLVNKTNLILMHGFQGYPTKIEDINLKRINHLKRKFNLKMGFADHYDASKELAIDMPIYAIFAGATLIEKHITLDRSKKEYDYYSSLEPTEFKEMVTKLRMAERSLGSEKINQSERNYLKDALKVVANKNIKKGEIIVKDKVAYKRCPDEKNLIMPDDFKNRLPIIADEDIKRNRPIVTDIIETPKITIGVICRLKSTRLKKKAILPINNIASIERCLLNCLAVPNVDDVILATSYLPEDNPLEQFTLDGRVKVIRSDPDNVAKRLLEVAESTNANIILRVTGDNPLISPEILEILINSHLLKGSDMTIPDYNEIALGTAGDVYTVEALRRLLRAEKPLTHTEYLSYYFINNPHIFDVNVVSMPTKFRYSSWRLTLDEKDDLKLFEKIFSDLKVNKEALYFSKVRDYLLKNPDVAMINSHIKVKWTDIKLLQEEILNATQL
ncbi:N-acetylneuraminate synthase family protein [Clostridiaceae bacterium M8S5]|nr:N-acetylneuraminate synthase family protein [Clostridiaceae bacterium M8S5]